MFVLCLIILGVLHGAHSQEDCVPDPVEGLQLDADYRLHWQDVTNCQITQYLIYISPVDGNTTSVWDTLFPFVHVFVLPSCELYRFVVVAVSFNVMSEESVLITKVPTEPDTNVTVTHMQATPQSDDSVFLEWELDQQWAHCVQFFRVVRWDGETVPVDTYTTFDNITIDGLAPCTQFEFTVTPIYNNDLEGGIGLVTYETPATNPHMPTLESVRPGPTFADMVWSLPSYSTNRCPISEVIVDGSPYLNQTIPITDSPSRPSISVHLSPLQSDSLYVFRVSVINSGGASTPVPVAIQTLPSEEVN